MTVSGRPGPRGKVSFPCHTRGGERRDTGLRSKVGVEKCLLGVKCLLGEERVDILPLSI